VEKDVTVTILPETADDGPRYVRVVAILAAGVARLLSDPVKPAVDLSPDVRVTTTTARPGGGDESWR
jgi:hypothetical protein